MSPDKPLDVTLYASYEELCAFCHTWGLYGVKEMAARSKDALSEAVYTLNMILGMHEPLLQRLKAEYLVCSVSRAFSYFPACLQSACLAQQRCCCQYILSSDIKLMLLGCMVHMPSHRSACLHLHLLTCLGILLSQPHHALVLTITHMVCWLLILCNLLLVCNLPSM